MFETPLLRLALAVPLIALCVSCATPVSRMDASGDIADTRSARVDGVPFHPQQARQCGPAALAMTLGWSGEPVGPDALSEQVFSPLPQGSLQASMVAAARRHGRIAYPISGYGELRQELDAGHPVIVLQNLGLSRAPAWHYAVAIGYDRDARTVTIHSGASPAVNRSERVFGNTWGRSGYWGLLVLPPGRLPATASEQRYLLAVEGLERTKRYRAAETAYLAALDRWPGSLGALIGLANARYALGELAGAGTALREAARVHPDNGVVQNNLALVLLDQGRQAEALEAARRAVAAGGPHLESYRETLRDVHSACAGLQCGH